MARALEQLVLGIVADFTPLRVSLSRIPNDDPYSLPEYVLQKINEGLYHCREIRRAGVVLGYTVFWLEDFPGGHREFVSVATVAKELNGSAALRFEIQEAFEILARENGCKSIRMHTVRHGLIQSAIHHGFHVAEVVLRKPVN